MVRCSDCLNAKGISVKVRWNLSQENKEILNSLIRRGLCVDEFCYCAKLGFIESVIMERECDKWQVENDLANSDCNNNNKLL